MAIEPKYYEIDMRKYGYCCYDVRIGLISIATIWTPKKNVRDYHQVRLLFNQEPGLIDYSKDRKFNSLDECKRYVHRAFKKQIKILAMYYGIIK